MKSRTLAAAVIGGALLALPGGLIASANTAAPPPASRCTIQVPAHPLTPAGLATPYLLAGAGCDETNTATSAFVQATIVDPNGVVSIYSPVVVNAGQKPLGTPTVPVIPTGSTVGIFFGFNAVDLHLVGPGAEQCVNGVHNSDFGQFAYCNAGNLYPTLDMAVAKGTLTIPPLGTSKLGDPCPTVESFAIVDQDPSDNVQTTYLTGGGNVVQNTAANRATWPQATVLGNPSDNGLLTKKVDPAIGCTPWTVADQTDPGTVSSSIALDEFQATHLQAGPVGAVPSIDEMALVNGKVSQDKLNLYRKGVDQAAWLPGDEMYYCTNLAHVAPAWLTLHTTQLQAAPSPFPQYSNLFTFMADRFVQTYEMALPTPGTVPTCDTVTGIPNPITTFSQIVGANITVPGA